MILGNLLVLLFGNTNYINSFYFMWENEKSSTFPVTETKILPSTNYMSLLWHVDERVSLSITGYYQIYTGNVGRSNL